MTNWIKKWWFSILCWVVMCLIFIFMFWFLYADDDLIIIGACICAFVILSLLFAFIGYVSVPKKEDTKYKRYKDFLEWYEKHKEKTQ